MFAPRDYVYKRSHHGLAVRAPAKVTSATQDNNPTTSSSDSIQTTEALTQLAPVTPTVTQPAASATSSAQLSASPASTPAVSSQSPASLSSSLSLSSQKSAAQTSASSTPTDTSIASTPSARGSTSTIAPSVSNRLSTATLFTPTSSLSPSTTSSPSSSGGVSTGTIIGGVAGTLAAIAVLGLLVMWCMRRQRNRDADDFDVQAFKRQSVALVDDPVEPPLSRNPRPPTMIERHNASPALAAQAGYGGQNFYGGYGGFGQQSPYPEMMQSPGPPPQAYGAPPMGYAGYNDPQQHISRHPSTMGYPGYAPQQSLARDSSNAAYLARQPSSATGFGTPTTTGSKDPNAHYIDLNRSSVSPYQAAQYADISRQLGTSNPNGHIPDTASDLPDEPLPSPFDDPVETTPASDATQPHVNSPTSAAAPSPVSVTYPPQTQGNTTETHHRPTTVYDEGDAYGGI